MKFKGQRPSRPAKAITLSNGCTLTVTAPRLGVHQRGFEVVPVPKVPARQVTVKGQPPALLYDEKDPAYQAADATADFLRLVYLAWEVLSTSEAVEFETKPDPAGPDRAFVQKLAAEMDGVGITLADLQALGEFASASAGVTEEEAESAEGFSGAPAGRRSPTSSGGPQGSGA